MLLLNRMTELNITQLPVDIYLLLRDFIVNPSYKSWRYFLSINRSMQYHRKMLFYYNCNVNTSKLFYHAPFFRQKLLERVHNPLQQISLQYPLHPLTELSFANHVHSLTIFNNEALTNLQGLTHVHSLKIDSCKLFKDLSSLTVIYHSL